MSIGNLIPILASANRAGAYVEDLFNSYVYKGNDGVQTATTGVDTLNDGGLIWFKGRNLNSNNFLFDTERGPNQVLWSNNTTDELPTGAGTFNFSSDGFSLNTNGSNLNQLGEDYVAWTWKKQERFFDVVTYTGPGTGAAYTVNHNLGSVPGVIILKKTSASQSWAVYHRSIPNKYLILESTDEAGNITIIDNVTDSSFRITVAGSTWSDADDYVAYLFAHNDGDGGFGPNGDADIIKCGSYTGNNSVQNIELGFEPQWLLVKNSSVVANSNSNWLIVDNMRQWTADGNVTYLQANQVGAEGSNTFFNLTPTGFQPRGSNVRANSNNDTFIYIAIRRGPMDQPESSADVFDVDGTAGSGIVPNFNSGFPVDMIINKNRVVVSNFHNSGRIIEKKFLQTDNNGGIGSNVNYTFDYQDGYYGANTNANYVSWMWRRYPGFFDVAYYTGDGVAGRTVTHNLGVTPEMIWVKKTNGLSGWPCYLAPLGATKYLELDNSNPESTDTATWNDTAPSDISFTVGDASRVNELDDTYIAYLFASLAGISKVGSYTGDGTTGRVIDCGFSNGARFVLIKRYDLNAPTAANWSVFDSYRGISSGNDPQLFFNEDDLEDTGHNLVDTTSSGFIVNHDATALSVQETNADGRSYIFYAVAT
jgi:hypothetical protein